MTFVTRFAPSPTGPLHLGHAYSALLAHDMARTEGGTFLLRIEDIDRARSRPEWEAQIFDDLRWLGLSWPDPVMGQFARLGTYRTVLKALWARDLLYHCTCTRRDIADALSAPQEGRAPVSGPDGPIYPGTCRNIPHQAGPTMPDATLRLDMRRAARILSDGSGRPPSLGFREAGHAPDGSTGDVEIFDIVETIGDVVLARTGMGTSYHLSVVLDDAAQGISHVVRGADLFEATRIHVVLQRLLNLPTPVYHHHRLIRDETGKRLAKRDDARALSKYRADGAAPDDIRRLVGLSPAI